MPQPPAFDPALFVLARLAQRRARQRQRLRERRALSPPAEPVRTTTQSVNPATRSISQRRGDEFETQALALMEQAGCRLLGRQLHCPFGELDLVVQQRELLIFVEVRARSRTDFGGAAASVTPAKQRKLLLSAQWWLPTLARQHFQGRTPTCRIDVIAFEPTQVFWYRDTMRIG
jgi:putative endonuclease